MTDHPEKKAEIYSPTTVVRWQGDELEGIPYHIAYRSFLEPAAKSLREAAALSDDHGVREFSAAARGRTAHRRLLCERSGMAGSEESEIRLIFAPYETYSTTSAGREGVVWRSGYDSQ